LGTGTPPPASMEAGLVLDPPQEGRGRGVWLEGDRDHRRVSWLHVALRPRPGLPQDSAALPVSRGGLKTRAPCRRAEICRLPSRDSHHPHHGPTKAPPGLQQRASSRCVPLPDSPAALGPGRSKPQFPGFCTSQEQNKEVHKSALTEFYFAAPHPAAPSTKPPGSPHPPPRLLPTARGRRHPALPRASPRGRRSGGGKINNGDWRLCCLPGLPPRSSTGPSAPLPHAPEGPRGRAEHPQPGEGGGAHGAGGRARAPSCQPGAARPALSDRAQLVTGAWVVAVLSSP